MLYDLLPPLESYFGALNVVRYITFRTAAASLTALFISLVLGPWMIRKLRDDWCATRGGRRAWKEFHDQFLSFGGPPIPLVRKAMLGKAEGLF